MDDLFAGCERPEAAAAPCELEQRPLVTVKEAKAHTGIYGSFESEVLLGTVDSVQV